MTSDPLEFRLPDVGEGIARAEILTWFVKVGDNVVEDGPMLEVETDKSVVDIPAPATGTVLRINAGVGSIAAVGDVIIVIGDPSAAPAQPDRIPTMGRETPVATLAARVPSVRAAHRALASPHTRRLAAQRGVDLTQIIGTGPHGRILQSDLDSVSDRDQINATTPASADAVSSLTKASRHRDNEVVPLRGVRRSIARAMTEALSIPRIMEFREVDATALLAARAALRPALAAGDIELTVLPLLLKAVVRALRLHPTMNATYDAESETLTKHAGVHLGVATATDDGLIVPVIHDADLLDLTELAATTNSLVASARSRQATPGELTGGSFTVTNFGALGTWLGTPIIRPPEVGIAGFGRVTEKVIARDGVPVVRPVLPIVVATDHRINDGADLALFMTAIADAVTEPVLLLA